MYLYISFLIYDRKKQLNYKIEKLTRFMASVKLKGWIRGLIIKRIYAPPPECNAKMRIHGWFNVETFQRQ